MIILITLGLSFTLFGLDAVTVVELQQSGSTFPFVLIAALIYVFCLVFVTALIKRKKIVKGNREKDNTKK